MMMSDTPATSSGLDLDQLLTQATQQRASDLHIRVGMPPMIRVDGNVKNLEGYGPITRNAAIELVATSITGEQQKEFYEKKSLDFSRAVKDVARFRCAYFLQQGLMSLVFRRIPDQIPTLAELRAPSILLDFARAPRGLVLVTGPTGSGKSTTLAAILDYINANRAEHILTIEDPIEFVHQPKRCIVNQREIGRDAPNFAHALRGALRQDPDVILVGEMRDLETIATAMTAAETGHLVFGTLHTSTAPSTIDRIVDQYPSDQQQQIRVMLASSLIGIVTQALLPRNDGPGRIAVHEVLVATNAVKANIRHNQMDQVRGTMQTQSKQGMQTMDQALAYYVHQNMIAEDVARQRAISRSDFDKTLQAWRAGGPVVAPKIIQPGQGAMQSNAPIGASAMGTPTQLPTSPTPAGLAPASMPMSPASTSFAPPPAPTVMKSPEPSTKSFAPPASLPGSGTGDASKSFAPPTPAPLPNIKADTPPTAFAPPAPMPTPEAVSQPKSFAPPAPVSMGGLGSISVESEEAARAARAASEALQAEQQDSPATNDRFKSLFGNEWPEDDNDQPPAIS